MLSIGAAPRRHTLLVDDPAVRGIDYPAMRRVNDSAMSRVHDSAMGRVNDAAVGGIDHTPVRRVGMDADAEQSDKRGQKCSYHVKSSQIYVKRITLMGGLLGPNRCATTGAKRYMGSRL